MSAHIGATGDTAEQQIGLDIRVDPIEEVSDKWRARREDLSKRREVVVVFRRDKFAEDLDVFRARAEDCDYAMRSWSYLRNNIRRDERTLEVLCHSPEQSRFEKGRSVVKNNGAAERERLQTHIPDHPPFLQ